MEADVAECQRILDARTPFQCFQLNAKKTDPYVIRSIYLKLAVKVHPDKNKSHLATQAFQVCLYIMNFTSFIQNFKAAFYFSFIKFK